MIATLFCLGTVFASGSVFPSPDVIDPPKISFDGLPNTASHRPTDPKGQPHQVHARMISDHDKIAPGQTFRLGIHLQQDKDWHTYWKSPGVVGKPTEITWKLPESVTAAPYQYPAPSYFEQSGLVSIGYENEVLLFSEVTIPESMPLGPTVFEADVEWLVCKESCIPGSAKLSLPLVVASAQTSAYTKLFDHYQQYLPQNSTDIKEFRVETALSASGIHPEEGFSFAMQITPQDGKKITIEKVHESWPFFTPIAGDYWMINESKFVDGKDGSIKILLEGESFEADTLPMNDRIGALLQIKVDDKWIRTEIELPLPLVKKETKTIPSTSPLFEGAQQNTESEQNSILTQNTVSNEQEKETSQAETAVEAKEVVAIQNSEPISMIYALFLAFFGGLLLNVMPCVLPVLIMKLFGLVKQSDITAQQQRTAGIAYSAGIVVSFLMLALVVVFLQNSFGLQIGWGFQFQYPEYVIALATIVFVFGLSLLGVFEIPAIGADQASKASNQKGWLGYFMTGVFATLLATPCSAPFLGTGIGFAFTLPAWGICTFFAVAGLGLAFPFLLVAFIPKFFEYLPKPGAWMETFKQIMGFTLIATTVWLVDVLGAQTGIAGTTGFLIFLIFVSIGCWIVGKWGSLIASPQQQIRSYAIAIFISSIAGYFSLTTEFAKAEITKIDMSETASLSFEQNIPWQPFSDETVRKLQGKPLFIDFTADWCLTCKANEKTILETESVRNAMNEYKIIPLKADWTRQDEDITKWLKKFGKAGVPFYLVISKDGTPIPLPEIITTDMVIDALRKGAS